FAPTPELYTRSLHDALPILSAVPTVLALVNAGMGVALIPRSASRLRSSATVVLPLADPDDVASVELYAAVRQSESSPLVGGAIDALLALDPATAPHRASADAGLPV